MLVSTLLERFEEAGLEPAVQKQLSDDILSRRIGHLTHDSRAVRDGGAFFAVRGGSTDGHLFIDKAVQQGAHLVVCEDVPHKNVAQTILVIVNDSRKALSVAAGAFYQDPARELTMIGVTGTNGKTTTAHLIYSLLKQVGWVPGIIGTIGVQYGSQELGLGLTTPDPIALQEVFRNMADAGCDTCVMEVSSHALSQHRTHGVSFDVALFMNLSQDHLDYHGSMEAYFQAKKILFDDLSPEAQAVYNADDPAGERIVVDSPARKTSFGMSGEATYNVRVQENSLDGLLLQLDGSVERFKLVGEFNAYNLAGAYAAGRALKLDRRIVLDALAGAGSVPGRFEQFVAPDGLRAIVDYAHTPAALENILLTVRGAAKRGARIWCVFGCGGDRDRSKRPKMGRIAEKLADHVVLTSDNPRSEDPHEIIQEIRTGLHSPDAAHVIENRGEAIRTVIEEAAAGDVVLVAGKGHETTQTVNNKKHHFDDRQEVTRHLAKRNQRSS